MKWTIIIEKKYALRSITNKNLKVPEKPKLKCMGFTYNEAKLFNMLPPQMRVKGPHKPLAGVCSRFSMRSNFKSWFLG